MIWKSTPKSVRGWRSLNEIKTDKKDFAANMVY